MFNEIIGWIGSVMVILAYGLNSYQKIRSDSLIFYLQYTWGRLARRIFFSQRRVCKCIYQCGLDSHRFAGVAKNRKSQVTLTWAREMELARKSIQIQKWVAGLSVALLVIKVTAYYLTSSLAILTDALEGIVNIVAGFFGLYSLYLSAKPRDDDHPYGHGKIEFVSALLEGSMILMAGLIIIFQAVMSLINPKPIQALDVGTALIAITAVVNYFMGWRCVRIGKKNNSMALTASGKHLQSDAFTTLGIIIGLAIVYFTDMLWLDSVVAIVFALVILWTGYKILRSSLAGILDETDISLLKRLAHVLNEHRRANWMDLHNLRIIKYGNVLHIDCHLTLPWYLNMHEAHLEIDDLTKLIRSNFGSAVEFFIHTDGCLEFSCRICSKSDCPVRQHLQERRIEWTVENISSNTKHTVDTQ